MTKGVPADRLVSAVTDIASPLYEVPLPAHRTGPLFNAVSYPTKISAESVALFIATHTDVGAQVLDVFSGSGSTGLAALLCDTPTEWMIETSARLGLNPKWGPRHAILYDVGVFPSLIARVMCNPPDVDEFRMAVQRILKLVGGELNAPYATAGPNDESGQIRHVVWSEFIECAKCGTEQSYLDSHVIWNPIRIESTGKCINCHTELRNEKRITEVISDPLLGHDITVRKRRPAIVYGTAKGMNWQRRALDQDFVAALMTPSEPMSARELQWGDLYRVGYHTGITHLHHLYTPRNYAVMTALWRAVDHEPLELHDALRLLLLSFNGPHATLMTRVVAKRGQKDFIVTGAQSGVLYVSALPVEKNILLGAERKASVFAAAFDAVTNSRSTVDVRCASSEKLDLETGSVDYVFTDPPFGDFIPYAEVNQVNELWLGVKTDMAAEITISRSKGRDVAEYGRLLGSVFSEVSRTLKHTCHVTLVFHAARSSVWQAIAKAVESAGFVVVAATILDKRQPSFKQVVAERGVRGDGLFLLSLSDRRRKDSAVGVDHIELARAVFIAANSNDPAEITPERLYSRYVGRCMRDGVHVELDARAFYQLVSQRP